MSVKRSNPAPSRAKTIRLSNRNSKCENYALLSNVFARPNVLDSCTQTGAMSTPSRKKGQRGHLPVRAVFDLAMRSA